MMHWEKSSKCVTPMGENFNLIGWLSVWLLSGHVMIGKFVLMFPPGRHPVTVPLNLPSEVSRKFHEERWAYLPPRKSTPLAGPTSPPFPKKDRRAEKMKKKRSSKKSPFNLPPPPGPLMMAVTLVLVSLTFQKKHTYGPIIVLYHQLPIKHCRYKFH